MNSSNKILAPISTGELIDKITILEIKCSFMKEEKLFNVKKELINLKNILKSILKKISIVNYRYSFLKLARVRD